MSLVKCLECNGSGLKDADNMCKYCNGNGTIVETLAYRVNVDEYDGISYEQMEILDRKSRITLKLKLLNIYYNAKSNLETLYLKLRARI